MRAAECVRRNACGRMRAAECVRWNTHSSMPLAQPAAPHHRHCGRRRLVLGSSRPPHKPTGHTDPEQQ
eukprot:1960445-Rhodomonas_salina.1